MADPVILINAFEVPAADADAFIAAWEKARDHLRSQPGYLHTAAPGDHAGRRVPVRQHRALADSRGLHRLRAKPWFRRVSRRPGPLPAAFRPLPDSAYLTVRAATSWPFYSFLCSLHLCRSDLRRWELP